MPGDACDSRATTMYILLLPVVRYSAEIRFCTSKDGIERVQEDVAGHLLYIHQPTSVVLYSPAD